MVPCSMKVSKLFAVIAASMVGRIMVEKNTEARKAQQLAEKCGLESPGTAKTSVSIGLC
jgi:hypothetical protein